MSTFIVYYSYGGNNATLANHLGRRLECGLLPIQEVKPRTNLSIVLDLLFGRLPRLQSIDKGFLDYDHVILVAPVWGGKLAAPLRTFLRLYREQLHDYSFITLCGYERAGQRDWLCSELARRVGRPPRAVCELRVSDLVPPERRRMLRVINAYRVKEAELGRYREAIDEFLQAARVLRPAIHQLDGSPVPQSGGQRQQPLRH